jgi:hypothetical protein
VYLTGGNKLYANIECFIYWNITPLKYQENPFLFRTPYIFFLTCILNLGSLLFGCKGCTSHSLVARATDMEVGALHEGEAGRKGFKRCIDILPYIPSLFTTGTCLHTKGISIQCLRKGLWKQL